MIWPLVFRLVVMLLISYATQPKPQRPKPAAFEDFDFPTAEEGTPQCVVFGDCWVEDWFVNGLGNYRQRAIKKGGGLFGGKQTVGYHYYFGVHAGISRGPVDEVVEIKVADRTVWKYNPEATDGPSLASINALQAWRDSGSRPPMPSLAREAYEYEKEDQIEWPFQITESMSIQIKASKIFGGDKGEGGVAGQLDLMFGEPDQGINPRLAAMTGPLTPAYRGKFTAFFDGLVCSMNPYPKPWKYRVRRVLSGWQDGIVWYPEKAVIWLASNTIKSENPAHILYEAHTNRQWGRGIPSSLMGTSWTAAADTLFAEGFGMCLRWTRQASVREFIDEVVNHIGGNVYLDPRTGKFELKLIRNDYVVDELPLFDFDSGLLALDDDESSATVVSANTVIVSYRDPITNTDGSVRVDNLASIRGADNVQPQTLNYPGVPTPELAVRLAQRELRARNTGVKRMRPRLDRRAHELLPGSVFRISAPEHGIEQVVLRAGRVEGGNRAAGTIVIDAVQDVFGLPSTSYVQIQPPTWTPPSTQPTPVTQRRVIELPYRDLVAASLSPIADNAGVLATIAPKPTDLSLDYDLQTRVGSNDWADRGTYDFCPSALLDDDMPITNESIMVSVNSMVDFESIEVGATAYINDEITTVIGIDIAGSRVTLGRGCVDTVPTAHAAGSQILFYAGGDFAGYDSTVYTEGTDVDVRLIPQSSGGSLPESQAAIDTIEIGRRQYRPYPAGNFQINGEDYPNNLRGNLTITWAGRNRLTQGATVVDASAGNIPPEDGTVYSITARRTDTNAIVAVTNPANSPQLFDPGYTGEISITINTIRNGVASLQSPTHVVDYLATGYGRAYGLSYGGTLTPGVALPRPPEPYPVWSPTDSYLYIESLDGYIGSAKWLLSDVAGTTSFTPPVVGPGAPRDADLVIDISGEVKSFRTIVGEDYASQPIQSVYPPSGSEWTFLRRLGSRYYWHYETNTADWMADLESRSTWYTDGTDGATPVLVFKPTSLDGYAYSSGRVSTPAQYPEVMIAITGGMSDEPIGFRPPDRPTKIHVINEATHAATVYDVSHLVTLRGQYLLFVAGHPDGGFIFHRVTANGIFSEYRSYITFDFVNFTPITRFINGEWQHVSIGLSASPVRYGAGRWWWGFLTSADGVQWEQIPDIAGQGSLYYNNLEVVDANDDVVVIKTLGTSYRIGTIDSPDYTIVWNTRTQMWITTDGTTYSELTLPALPTPAPNAPDLPNAPALYPYPGRLIAFKHGWLAMFPKTVVYPATLLPGIAVYYTEELTASPTWLPLSSIPNPIIGTTVAINQSSGTISFNVPDGAEDGDNLLVFVRVRADRSITIPGGWTTLLDIKIPSGSTNTANTRIYVLSKAWASEASLSFTHSAAAAYGGACMLLRGTVGNTNSSYSTSVSLTKEEATSMVLAVTMDNSYPATDDSARAVGYQHLARSYFLDGPEFYGSFFDIRGDDAPGVLSITTNYPGSTPAQRCVFVAEIKQPE